MHFADALQRYFEALEAQHRFAGVVSVTRGDSVLFAEAFGYASRAWGIKTSLDLRFDIASVTKLFTAVGILQLVDQKRLALDTSVIGALGLTGTNISKDVTVYHLLTHTSGIGDDAEEEDGESYEALWRDKPNYPVTEASDFLPQFVHKPPNFPPGQGCRYCNCGYILLGLLIEKVSGLGYRDYVRQNIFSRAGMDDSAFLRLDRSEGRVAEGADPIFNQTGQITAWKKNICSFPPVGTPASGAYATARDLDRFLHVVKAGEILSHEETEAFFTPQVYYQEVEDGTIRYGYGQWFFVDRSGRALFCEKDGVSAVLRHYLSDDVTVVLLSNMESGAWEPIRRVHEAVMASLGT